MGNFGWAQLSSACSLSWAYSFVCGQIPGHQRKVGLEWLELEWFVSIPILQQGSPGMFLCCRPKPKRESRSKTICGQSLELTRHFCFTLVASHSKASSDSEEEETDTMFQLS